MSSTGDTAPPPQPQLPFGDPSLLTSLYQSLSFHSSPETFIQRVRQDYAQSGTSQPSPPFASASASAPASQPDRDANADLNPYPTPKAHEAVNAPIIRARILGRNVAIVTTHLFCSAVLQAGSQTTSRDAAQQHHQIITTHPASSGSTIDANTFIAHAAYAELMAPFFPLPNLLLQDGAIHAEARRNWDAQVRDLPTDAGAGISEGVREFMGKWQEGSEVDLYDAMKDLSWRLLLGVFLGLKHGDRDGDGSGDGGKEFRELEELQETLLRGQFSLFPVSVNVGLWRSPRSKALSARQKLQALLGARVSKMESGAGCPFTKHRHVGDGELAANALLFTSSIAVKALASLLTATLLNLFLQPVSPSLAERVKSEGPENGPRLLESILLETERLSPPVIGIMRRAQQDVVFASVEGGKAETEEHPILVPKSWDVWLYFGGAGRDEAAFQMADRFIPERYVASGETKPGFAFGGGTKTCLGRDLVREIVKIVAASMIDSELRLEGSVEKEGVRAWLGWEGSVNVEAVARDMKQLPVQRPKDPVFVRVRRR